MFDRVFSPTKNDSQSVGERVADEDVGLGFFEYLADFFQSNGWVKNNGDDAELEQGESKGEELDAGRSHHSCGEAGGQRAGRKSRKEAVGLVKKLGVGESLPGVLVKVNEGRFVGVSAGGLFKFGEEIHATIL